MRFIKQSGKIHPEMADVQIKIYIDYESERLILTIKVLSLQYLGIIFL